MLKLGLFVPHPPAAIPQIGGEGARKFEKTIGSLLTLSELLAASKIETIFLLTSHADLQADRFVVRVPEEENFVTRLSDFAEEILEQEYSRDRVLTASVIESIAAAGLKTEPLTERELDFGSSVPLHFLASQLPGVQLVNLGVSLLGAPQHAKLGEVLAEVANSTEKNVAIVVSGELSHRLSKSSPHGFSPQSAEFDSQIVEAVQDGEYDEILAADPWLRDEVAECGWRGLCALVGAFAGTPHESKVLSYESPTGIGLLTAVFSPRKSD